MSQEITDEPGPEAVTSDFAELPPDTHPDAVVKGVEASVDDEDNPAVATAGPTLLHAAQQLQGKKLTIAQLTGDLHGETASSLAQFVAQVEERNSKSMEAIRRALAVSPGADQALARITEQKSTLAGLLGGPSSTAQFALAQIAAHADESNRKNMALLGRVLSENSRFEQAMGRIREQNSAQLAALRDAVSVGFEPTYDRLFSQLREAALTSFTFPTSDYDFGNSLGSIVEAYAHKTSDLAKYVRRIAEAWDPLIPANLRDMRTAELGKVFEINVQEGTSLAWAPRSEIVRELLDASDMETRSTVLITRAADIADDVEKSLGEVVLSEHQELRAMLLDATKALRAGIYYGAQATACNALDTIINVRTLAHLKDTVGDNASEIRNYFRRENWRDVYMSDLDLVMAGCGLATVFRYWKKGKGRLSFNRHGSVHHVDDGSYSPAHAVRALLIAHAMLRWLDAAIRTGSEEAAA